MAFNLKALFTALFSVQLVPKNRLYKEGWQAPCAANHVDIWTVITVTGEWSQLGICVAFPAAFIKHESWETDRPARYVPWVEPDYSRGHPVTRHSYWCRVITSTLPRRRGELSPDWRSSHWLRSPPPSLVFCYCPSSDRAFGWSCRLQPDLTASLVEDPESRGHYGGLD